MSDFSGYEKIPDSLKKLALDEHDLAHLEKLQWVVTEKVHGANFSFVYEKGHLKFAKRKEYLSWTDDFFGFQLVVKELENRVLRLFESLSSRIEAEKYIIYGELFGGEYPHPEVAPNKHVQAVQTGVYYAPSIEFCAFDIAVVPVGTAPKFYLDYQTALSYFSENNLFHARPLFVGKSGEAFNFNTRINSSIPGALGLPALEENLIEGVVIKPYDYSGAAGSRPVIKLKNPEFEEQKKFHEAQKWTYIPEVSTNTLELAFLVDELRAYINENRLASAESKVGRLDFSRPDRVAEIGAEFLADVLADFNENNGNLLEELTTEQKGWVTERIRADVERMIGLQRRDV